MEEKAREIDILQIEQEELKTKTVEEIIEMKKEIDHLIVENSHIFYSWIQVEEAVANTCKRACKNTVELDAFAKSRRLGEIIVQLRQDSNILNDPIYLETPLEKITEWKNFIEEVASQLEELSQEDKKIIEAMTQFLGSAIQEE